MRALLFVLWLKFDPVIRLGIPLLVGRAGAFFQWAAAAVVAWLATWVSAHLGLDLTPETWTKVQVGLMGLGVFVLHSATQWYQANAAARIQAIANEVYVTKQDAWLGTETIGTIELLASMTAEYIKEIKTKRSNDPSTGDLHLDQIV